MDYVSRMLKRAKEADVGSREQYMFESSALSTIKGMVSIWADDTHRGEKMKGHNLVRWKKDVYRRIQELHEIFEKDGEK